MAGLGLSVRRFGRVWLSYALRFVTPIILAVAALLVPSSGHAQTWYDLSWQYRKPITIAGGQIAGNLSDFPVLISLTDTDLSAQALANGFDILFTDTDGVTKLDHERTRWVSGTGELIAWVKVTSLAAAVDKTLYMYYGNSGASDQQSAAAVWSNGYEAVYHLDDDFADATGKHAAGTNFNSVDVPARIGDGQDFEQTNLTDHIDLGTWSVAGSQLTIQSWVRYESFSTADARVISKAVDAMDQDHVFMLSNLNGGPPNNWRMRLKTGTLDASGTTVLIQPTNTVNLNTWYLTAATYDGATMRLLQDGGQVASVAKTGSLRENGWSIYLGNNPRNGATPWYMALDGILDEVRISSAARPSSWLTTEYNNQRPGATFYGVGSEEILLPFVVNTDSDVADGDTTSIPNLRADPGADGFISLREAISAANQTANGAVPDSIKFAIGSGVQTITPATALPSITEAVIIDGTTQPGFTGTPIIEISGAAAGNVFGLTVSAGGSTIRGLVINRFATGIALTGGSGHVIAGNYLGPDVTGGVGNVGNTQEGLLIVGSRANIIGGAGADRNVISGNRARGIWIDDFSDGAPAISDANQIYGNYIGTNAAGTARLPYSPGVYQQIGIAIWDGLDNVIGGIGQGNVISGNAWYGLYVWGPNSTGNQILGNIVGLDATASNPVGNAFESATRAGILLSNSPGTTVGDAAAGAGNTISGNDAIGVLVGSDGATGNTISGNSVYGNVGFGIDLGPAYGVTPNESGDGDTGPNNLLNFPYFEYAVLDAATDTLEIAGFARPGVDIELFVSDSDGSGFGEGQTYLVTVTEGSADDLDDGTGSYTHAQAGSDDTNRFRFRIENPGGIAVGTELTATATDGGDNTSEFSLNVQVVAAQDLFFSSAADQTFWVGKAPTAISPITVGEGLPTAITDADDLRIRIPSGFNMVWDTLDLTPTLTGTASGKVSPTVSYEDAGATLVLDVTSDFAFGDTVTVADLSFMGFTGSSGTDNLELELENDGAVSATDARTIEILPPGTPVFYSEDDQSFRTGDPPQSSSRITLRADAAAPTITAANDIRIHIPFGFNMRWDNLTPVTILGTASGKVSNAVSYEDGGMTLVVDVLTDFDPNDFITIEGVGFRNFNAPSLEDNLELELFNDGAVSAVDPQIIFIVQLDAPTISSSKNQGFTTGDPPTKASAMRVTASDVVSQITAANDIRIRIPASLQMVWDISQVGKIAGQGKNKVSPTVTYEDGGKTAVIEVLIDFNPKEFILVSDLVFTTFGSAGPPKRLELLAFNDGVVSDVDDKTKTILGSIFRVDVWPSTVTEDRLPSNGTDYAVQFTVSNTGNTSDDFDLLTSTSPGGVITVVSMTGLDVTQGANPDSARIGGLPASDSRVVTVTYSVGQAPLATTDTLIFLARAVSNPTQNDEGRLELTVVRPQITMGKTVDPNGTQPPGTDLTYTVTVTNTGSEDAADLVSVDSLAAELEFQVGSMDTTLPTGVTVVVEYSDNGGGTWTYSPTSGACAATAGYDRCVNRIRLTFQNPLSSTAPDNVAQFEYVARIR